MKLFEKLFGKKVKTKKVLYMGTANGGEAERMRKIVEADPITYIKGWKFRSIVEPDLCETERLELLKKYSYNIDNMYNGEIGEPTVEDIGKLFEIARSFECDIDLINDKIFEELDRKQEVTNYENCKRYNSYIG